MVNDYNFYNLLFLDLNIRVHSFIDELSDSKDFLLEIHSVTENILHR